MADGCGEEASAQKNKNCGYYKAKCLVQVWAGVAIYADIVEAKECLRRRLGPMKKCSGNRVCIVTQ